MKSSADLHSPKQVAQALGVSESSLKRWCDRGFIKTTRTAGGHRKVLTADAIEFAKSRGISFVSPEALGLPPLSDTATAQFENSAQLLCDALLAGNESICRQIVLNLTLTGVTLSRIFDDVLARAFAKIGDRWACQEADVYQERRGCEIMLRTLSELRKQQVRVEGKLTACGGTAAGNPYSLQTMMTELVLRDCGFQAASLGMSIPFESLARAIRDTRPTIFWLSAAYIPDDREFLNGFSLLSSECARTKSALVIGGRAIPQSMREQMVYASYCDTMQQLATFASSIRQAHQSPMDAITSEPGHA